MLAFILRIFGIFGSPQRNSETWAMLGVLIGQLGTQQGWFSQSDWDKLLWPTLVYIVLRVTSKLAKAVPVAIAELAKQASAAQNAK